MWKTWEIVESTVCSLMWIVRLCAHENALSHCTFERLFTCMCSCVISKIICGRDSFITKKSTTFIRHLSCVFPHMNSLWARKLFITLCTFERLFTGMCSHVGHKISQLSERFITLRTFERLLSCVCSHVYSQIFGSNTRVITLCKFVWFLSFMGSDVCF